MCERYARVHLSLKELKYVEDCEKSIWIVILYEVVVLEETHADYRSTVVGK